MTHSEELALSSPLLNNASTQQLATKRKAFIRSLEYIYSHPWRALLLKKLLPSFVFNRWIMDKRVYEVVSLLSQLGLHHRLKEVLSQYAAPHQLDEAACLCLKTIAYNSELNDIATAEILYKLALQTQLSFSDCKNLYGISERFAKDDNRYTQLRKIISDPQLTTQVVVKLNAVIEKYTTLNDFEHGQLQAIAKKNRIAKHEQDQLLTLAKNPSLSHSERSLLTTLATKTGTLITKAKLTQQEQAALTAIANKSQLDHSDYENLTKLADQIALRSEYTMADRDQLRAFSLNEKLNKTDKKTLLAIAKLASYGAKESEQLKAMALNPNLSNLDRHLLLQIASKQRLTAQSSKALIEFVDNHVLDTTTKRQLKAIIDAAKQFRLAQDFEPEVFFEETLVRHFLEDIQPKYQGTAETKYLSRWERRLLNNMANSLDSSTSEARLIRQLANQRYLSAKDSKQLAAVIKNPHLTMEDYNALKTLAEQAKLTPTDLQTLQELMVRVPQLSIPLASISRKFNLDLNEVADRVFKLSAQNREDLITAAENSALSMATREKLKTILENKQLSLAARNFLRKTKIALNRVSDAYEFEVRLAWLPGERGFTKLILANDRRTKLQDRLMEKKAAYDFLTEMEQFVYQQDRHRLNIEEKLIRIYQANKARKIKQRQYKQITHEIGKVVTDLFAMVSGLMAAVATATAFAFNPGVAIPLALIVFIGTTITCNQLNSNNLSNFFINLSIKRNLFAHTSGKQKLLLLILGAGCGLAGVGAGILFYSLITAHLAAALALVGIACPPLIPIIIGISFAPLIGVIVFATYFNTMQKIVKHYSLTNLFNFLYKNLIQDVINAENFSERIAHICKGICLIAFGIGGIVLAGAAAVIAATVLREAAAPLLPSIIHIGKQISINFAPVVKSLLLTLMAAVASIRFLATSEHFSKLTRTIADLAKQGASKLLKPLQNYFTPQRALTQDLTLPDTSIAKPSLLQKIKTFFNKKVPDKIKQIKENPWSLIKPASLIRDIASSGLILVNGIGEGAVPAAVTTTTIEIAEESGEAALMAIASIPSAAQSLLNNAPPARSSRVIHQRVGAGRYSIFFENNYNNKLEIIDDNEISISLSNNIH